MYNISTVDAMSLKKSLAKISRLLQEMADNAGDNPAVKEESAVLAI